MAKGKAVDAERRTLEAALAEAQRLATEAQAAQAALQLQAAEAAAQAAQAGEQALTAQALLAEAEAERASLQSSLATAKSELQAALVPGAASAPPVLLTPSSTNSRRRPAERGSVAVDMGDAEENAGADSRAFRSWREGASRAGRLGSLVSRAPGRLGRSLDAADRGVDSFMRLLRSHPQARVIAVVYIVATHALLFTALHAGHAAAVTAVEASGAVLP